MIEHDMRFVMGLCEEISVLNFGKHHRPRRPRRRSATIRR